MPSAWFAACSLALSLSQPAPAPFPYPEGAGLDFRNQTNQGVALVAGGEGTTEIGEWDGVRCLQTSAAEQAYYVYLQIPGDFIRPGRDTLTFEVEYLDNGRGPVLLQVESALPCIAIGGFSYRVAGQLWRAGSGRWRTARWQVTDEAFADPARQAVRFRLFAEEWVPGDRTLRVASVRVSHAAIRMEPEHQVLLPPLVSDREPRHELRLHAVEDVERLVDPREGRPPHGRGGRQRIEVADPGGELFLRDDQHARRRCRPLARAAREQSRREGDGHRCHPEGARDHEIVPYTLT